ncbi:MAG: 2-oxo-4-hydroxy-4-carboxy-5-ureidoimidazoline decarboxylase [Betaproteobacteria bacterium]|nr:2-oxo-4-hydroxy-4-carboxy-5-ureidoimidazoline decarboxylase [Betaproteobacteria bacterium]
MQLSSLNAADQKGFVAALGVVFEHSPWVAERAWNKRPFPDADGLHSGLMAAVREAAHFEKLTLIRAHPELAGREAAQGGLTADSSTEQGRLGFTALSHEEFLRMGELNRQYRERFGFPCIVALRLHDSRASVMSEMQRCLGCDPASEIERALWQIGEIARGRLDKILGAQ